MDDLCPCGNEYKVITKRSICLNAEVDVRYCLCGRQRDIIEYGKFDKATSCSDKFKILADELG